MTFINNNETYINDLIKQFVIAVKQDTEIFSLMDEMELQSLGNHHQLFHKIVENFVRQMNVDNLQNQEVLCRIAYCINMSSDDGIRLVFYILRQLIPITVRDCVTILYKVPQLKLESSQFSDIRNCLLDILMRISVETPREVIENLSDYLESPDIMIVKIAFLFIRNWLTGGLPRDTNLDNFMPVLDKYLEGDDSYKKERSLEVKKLLSMITHKT
jgi:hypothetical protein